MAFGGAAVFLAAGARVGQSRNMIEEVSGVSLAIFVASPPVRANADVGVLSSNGGAIDAVPANTQSLPAAFGSGPDNWSQSDVDALTVLAQDTLAAVTKIASFKALVANVNPAPAAPVITNANVEVTVQNLGAGAAAALEVRLILEHTAIR